MNPLKLGGGIALLVAAKPLYDLAQSGQLTGTSALLRWAVVATACVVGASYIAGIVDGYARDWRRTERIAALIRQSEEAIAAQQAAQAPAQPPADAAQADKKVST